MSYPRRWVSRLQDTLNNSDGFMKTYYVYLMASNKNGTLYIGVTNNLTHRVWQHKNDVHEGFTKKYGVHHLVWYEATTDVAGGYPEREVDEEMAPAVED